MDGIDQYPDSSDSSTESHSPSNRTRPPPPSALENGLSVKHQCPDEVQLPKIIAVQPREDKFLVHVYLPLAHPSLDSFVRKLMGIARLRLTGRPVKATFTELTDLHISIARPVTIREAQILGLVGDLATAVRNCTAVQIGIQSTVEGFASSNGHRVFVAAPLTRETGNKVVEGLIKAVDAVYERWGLPLFFQDPKPHMSFAWTEKVEVLAKFASGVSPHPIEDAKGLEVFVDKVECSIGKSKYYFTMK